MFRIARRFLAIDGKTPRNSSNTGEGSSSGIQPGSSKKSTKEKGKDKKSDNLNASMKRPNTDELNDFSKLEDDPRLPLNKRQIFKITKSWKAIARTMCRTGTAMFLKFQHLKKNELQESMELKEHAATVMSTLDQSISALNDYDNFVNYLHSIGELHRKIPDFRREHFWKIEEPFMKAVKQTLDERCNETIEEIYRIAIKLIIETIAEGYGHGQTTGDEIGGADRDSKAPGSAQRDPKSGSEHGDNAHSESGSGGGRLQKDGQPGANKPRESQSGRQSSNGSQGKRVNIRLNGTILAKYWPTIQGESTNECSAQCEDDEMKVSQSSNRRPSKELSAKPTKHDACPDTITGLLEFLVSPSNKIRKSNEAPPSKRETNAEIETTLEAFKMMLTSISRGKSARNLGMSGEGEEEKLFSEKGLNLIRSEIRGQKQTIDRDYHAKGDTNRDQESLTEPKGFTCRMDKKGTLTKARNTLTDVSAGDGFTVCCNYYQDLDASVGILNGKARKQIDGFAIPISAATNIHQTTDKTCQRSYDRVVSKAAVAPGNEIASSELEDSDNENLVRLNENLFDNDATKAYHWSLAAGNMDMNSDGMTEEYSNGNSTSMMKVAQMDSRCSKGENIGFNTSERHQNNGELEKQSSANIEGLICPFESSTPKNRNEEPLSFENDTRIKTMTTVESAHRPTLKLHKGIKLSGFQVKRNFRSDTRKQNIIPKDPKLSTNLEELGELIKMLLLATVASKNSTSLTEKGLKGEMISS